MTVFDARANRQIAGRGILQRILWSVPPDNVGYRDTYPRPLDPSVPEVWRTVYRRANEQARRAPVLDLSEGARALFAGWHEVHERSLRDLDGILKEWQSKAPGHVLRLAGIWQLCVGGDRVSEDAVAGALDIMAYFGAHARVALVSAGVDPRAALARKIAR